MIRPAAGVFGLRYETELGPIEVVRSHAVSKHDSIRLARRGLEIASHALADQIPDIWEEAAPVFDPDDPELVAKRARALMDSQSVEGHAPDRSLYVHARFPAHPAAKPEAGDIIGVAKARFDDRRSRSRREQDPDSAASHNLLQLLGMYTDSRWGETATNLQGHNVGAAMLHFVTTQCDPNMPTEILDFSELNPRLVPVITRLGYAEVGRQPGTFAHSVQSPLFRYGWVNCGQLQSALGWRLDTVTPLETSP